jgi:hypothetical protein
VGSDFIAINQQLTFLSGATPGTNSQECFSFQPINDILIEFTEDIEIQATSTNADAMFNMGGNQAFIDIIDNDSMCLSLHADVLPTFA